jgi:hypothetical protein
MYFPPFIVTSADLRNGAKRRAFFSHAVNVITPKTTGNMLISPRERSKGCPTLGVAQPDPSNRIDQI